MSVKVYIASFGYAEVIRRALEQKGYAVDGILTPSLYFCFTDGEDMGDKNQMMRTIMRQEKDRKSFLLVDDSFKNIEAVEREKENVPASGFYVSGGRGITETMAKRIIDKIQKDHVDCLVLDADMTLFENHVTSEYVYDFLEFQKKPLSEFDVRLARFASGVEILFEYLSDINA